LVGPAAFALASVVGARRLPDYRHRDEPMSALAAKGCPSSPIMVSGFLVLGTATWLLAGSVEGTRAPRPVGSLMRVASVATVVSGLARQSDRSCPVRLLGDEHVTLSDDAHVLAGTIVFGTWIAMPLVAAARGRGLRPAERGLSLALGLGALFGWIWTSVLAQRNAPTFGGLAQRVTVASALAWFPVAAIAASR
jgi:hypothetical protein